MKADYINEKRSIN